jgi:hypothetical protein
VSHNQEFVSALKMFLCLLFLTFLKGYTEFLKISSVSKPGALAGIPFLMEQCLHCTEHLSLESLPPAGLVKYYMPAFKARPNWISCVKIPKLLLSALGEKIKLFDKMSLRFLDSSCVKILIDFYIMPA